MNSPVLPPAERWHDLVHPQPSASASPDRAADGGNWPPVNDLDAQAIRDAVSAITRFGAMPVDKIPRHVAAEHLTFWVRAALLLRRPDLRQQILARFRVAKLPTARYGHPFEAEPTSRCVHRGCGLPLTLLPAGVDSEGDSEGEWCHDIAPGSPHQPQPATSRIRSVSTR